MRRNAAKRGFGRGAAIASSTAPAAGPEMRMTATPARPWPLERAKMVALLGSSERAIALSRVLPVLPPSRCGYGPPPWTRRWSQLIMSENRLARETSPYLLQHKDNPVHWWAWGPEALAEAKRTNKPILLSVGYAACHWCHVMAHESFEDAGHRRAS